MQLQQDVAPPRVIVPLPHAAVAVRADEGRAREQQVPPGRVVLAQGVRRGEGHHRAVEVMHAVVAHRLAVRAVHAVIEVAVILRVVRHAHEDAPQAEAVLHLRVVAAQLIRHLPGVAQTVLGVEQGGLVHVVPEGVDARVQQRAVLLAEPTPGLAVQEVRQGAAARPHRADEIAPILALAEEALLVALGVDRGPRVLLDRRVHDGDQMNVILPQVGGELRQIGDQLPVPGEVPEAVHVVDVHADAVQRDAALAVFPGDLARVLVAGVAPAALDVAEGPSGRHIAAARQPAELPADGGKALRGEHVHVQVAAHRGDHRAVEVRPPQVEGHLPGQLAEAEELLGVLA